MRHGEREIRLLAYTGATGWGGAEIVLGHLLAALGPHLRPAVLGVDPEVTARIAARRPGTPVRLVPPVSGKRDVAAMRAHRRAIAAARPDIVQVNLPVPVAEQYTVLAALTVPGVRVVAVEHLPMATGSRPARMLKRATARRLAAHLAVGSGAAREVERLCGLPSGSVRPVPNGVPDIPPGPPGRERGRWPGFAVGAVGRLHRQKGLDVLVRAVAQLPDVRLVLVGDGPERGALERLADALGMRSRLTVTGWTDEPAAYLASFDAVALPSRFEGLPLALLEAMLAGRAVVTTGVGSISDAVLDGKTGLIVPVDDPAALAAALRRLLDDAGLRTRLGTAARDLVSHRFTPAAMAAAYEDVYAEILRHR
jgi:glycosyltransferase involved in cell wall biosynthesis